MKKTCLCFWVVALFSSAYGADEVPETMRYCGIELSIDSDARASISETIRQLKRSPDYFQSLVDRANIYLPFVEEAFELRGVPPDLRYIVAMESAFVPDAVSSSNAVGFWQFKEQSAREAGLAIDEYVDERKHIFQSSLAAAKYFYTIARYFDNYLYAVIGFNRGPVGALPYINSKDLGNDRMKITKATHWYALKAIAYKLAFEESLYKSDPPTWLQPMNTKGETSVPQLAASVGLTLDDFKKYNLWIKGSALPEGRNFIYYLPRNGKREMAALRHVGGDTPQEKERPKPDPAKSPARVTQQFPCLEPMQDQDNGIDYVRAGMGESLVEIAVKHGVKVRKLKEINGFTNASRLLEGDIVYLKSAKSRHFHIVQEGETLGGIAKSYGTTAEKLREKNRISGDNVLAYQKLSLKKRVAKGSKPVLLCNSAKAGAASASDPVKADAPKPKMPPPVRTEDPGGYRLTPFESKWVVHTAVQGESVWKIARRYGAFSEVVKKINGLNSNELKPGTVLKVLQVTDQK